MAGRTREAVPRRTAVGVGLIALDVIFDRGSSTPVLCSGGTCANVLTILTYLGWNGRPVGRLGEDSAASVVRCDLGRWGVDLSLAELRPAARTPVVVERLRVDRSGVPFHTFSFFCQECGSRFPGFRPVTAAAVGEIFDNTSRPDVLFVDRASKSAVVLAEGYGAFNTLIVFEPQTIDESRSCRILLERAHVVKYSHERIDELPAAESPDRMLEIQTLGRGGLRFRTGRRWNYLEAEIVRDLRDAAGSGDWLTAALIHCLSGTQMSPGSVIDVALVEEALAVGQKLAAWNCSFLGARGGMYSAGRDEVFAIVEGAGDCDAPREESRRDLPTGLAAGFCAGCRGEASGSKQVAASEGSLSLGQEEDR